MSLAYKTTLPITIIGSKTSDGTRTGIELESTYSTTEVVEPTKTFEVGGYSKVAIDVLYTMGAAETSNTIEMKLEGSPDRINFYPLSTDTTLAGTSTIAAREWTFTGTNGAAAAISIFVDIGYKYLRASFKESGVAANKGNLYAEITLSGK